MKRDLFEFMDSKIRSLAARARRLSRFDHRMLGLRPTDLPYAPSPAHFAAANARLAQIDGHVASQLRQIASELRDPAVRHETLLRQSALVEREVDRARRAYGLFFDVFIQRGTGFAPALAACDSIAADCFSVVRVHAPGVLSGPLLKPVTYLEHSFSPATFRRGVVLRRLLGELNPFPLVRVPYEHVQSPWGMGVVLHEIGHNLHSDMRIWQETQAGVQRRVWQVTHDAWVTRIWARWHKEIFADLIALLLGGPASALAMKEFLAYPAARVLTFRPLSVHPTPYLRMFIQAEMLRRMGFADDARRLASVWTDLYGHATGRDRLPAPLLASARRVIPHVVDEIAFQPKRGLGQRPLVDVVPFTADDERQIRQAAAAIGAGQLPRGLAPRFAVSASRYAFDRRLADASEISRTVLGGLAQRVTAERTAARAAATAAA